MFKYIVSSLNYTNTVKYSFHDRNPIAHTHCTMFRWIKLMLIFKTFYPLYENSDF